MVDLPLAGRRILVVEDEPVIMMDVASALKDAGAIAVEAFSVNQALQHVSTQTFAAAVLDVKLADGDINQLTVSLSALGVPYVFHTACTPYNAVRGIPVLIKPCDLSLLVSAVRNMMTGPTCSSDRTTAKMSASGLSGL